jgi:hypothetical protein
MFKKKLKNDVINYILFLGVITNMIASVGLYIHSNNIAEIIHLLIMFFICSVVLLCFLEFEQNDRGYIIIK